MFSPYHKFANCSKLEKIISEIHSQTPISDLIINNYKIYHWSLIHKLKSAQYYIISLNDILSNSVPQDIVSDLSDFSFKINRDIDGYFYSNGSALDILAREVLAYFNIPFPTSVYFRTARNELQSNRPGHSLLTKLSDPSWKDEFSNYRNALTHELLIGGKYSIQVVVDGSEHKTRVVYPLPDDPRIEMNSRTFRRNENVLDYCSLNFRRTLSLINQIYGEIYTLIQNTNSLPL